MGRNALKISGVLIAIYLFGAKATDWGKLILQAGQAGSATVKTFQGR